jgi:hypothetical protein
LAFWLLKCAIVVDWVENAACTGSSLASKMFLVLVIAEVHDLVLAISLELVVSPPLPLSCLYLPFPYSMAIWSPQAAKS